MTRRSSHTASATAGSSSGVRGSRNQFGASRWNRCAAVRDASRRDGSSAADTFSRAAEAASSSPISRSAPGTPDRNSASASLRASPVSRVRYPPTSR
ncbi:hypothetical protein GCM10019016_028270 [Streptomyces prasinosporus]|uniref:Uncharacterized protein n=1 Tax=Streptomyces prasinosporus TaxID=68256 RepID=A0ABP6TKH0_9ACTN